MSVLGVFLARLKGLILVKFHFERLHSASFSSPEISTEVSVLLAFALACRCCLSMALLSMLGPCGLLHRDQAGIARPDVHQRRAFRLHFDHH